MVWNNSMSPIAKGWRSRVKIKEEMIIIGEKIIINEIQRIV